ncbi:hypothetical protein ZIOFF_065567 [Zingiber officinale]|uniref:Uncharacterized protein n=1 Tax=Zingiber officinale TaxID=94328 RepID=A0A8J5KH71_ZINOF|nr:hypothetical protein ZIOFF_065567 [Zingiber officinale]
MLSGVGVKELNPRQNELEDRHSQIAGLTENVARRDEDGYYSYSIVEISASSRLASKQNVSRLISGINMSDNEPVKYNMVGLDGLVSGQLNQAPNLSEQGWFSFALGSLKDFDGDDISKSFLEEEDPDYVDTGKLKRRSSLSLVPSKGFYHIAPSNVVSDNVYRIMRSKAQGQKKLQLKLKRLKGHLKWWNLDVFGNIHNRKRRLDARIFRIWDNGVCLEKAELIQVSGAECFERLLVGEEKMNSVDLEYILSLISPKENLAFLAPPTLEEVKQVVWEMCEDNAEGPDGFSVTFYKSCWEIIKWDAHNAVLDFFQVWVSAGAGISQLEVVFGFSYGDLLLGFWCLDFLELCL